MLVPLLVLLAIDRLEWSLYASFGAFTALYGRERVDLHRLALQTTVGVLQTTLITLGAVVAISPERAWLAVPIAALVAVLSTWLSVGGRWHPPGPIFQVFAFSAVASVPGTWEQVPVAAAVAASAAAFALIVGNIGGLWRRVRRTAPLEPPELPIGGVVAGLWRQAWLSGAGVLLAGSIATAGGIGRPYWAMVSAAVPLMAVTLTGQVVRGLHRLIGTYLGLLVAAVLLLPEVEPLVLIFLVAALQALAELFIGRNYALGLVFVTPLALLMVHLASPTEVPQLILDRGLETTIGVLIGVLVGLAGRGIPEKRRTSLPSGA